MSQLFFLTLSCVVGFVAAGPINGPCCLKKTVGNVSYTIVEQTDTSEFDCLSNCVYEQDGVPGSRFCFAHGALPVVCNGLGRPHEAIFCGEDLKKLLDEFSEKNTTAAARCCTKDKISSCSGHDCTDVCDVEVKCLKLVAFGDLSNDEHCRKDMEGRHYPPGPWGIDLVVAVQGPGQCPTDECPTHWRDKSSICCRTKPYDTACNKNGVDHCKCKVTCDWMADKKYCFGACSWCCSCQRYKTACPSTCGTGTSPQPFTSDPTPDPYVCPDCPTGPATDTCCDKCQEKEYRERCPIQCKCNCFCNKIVTEQVTQTYGGFSNCYPDWSSCCECKTLGNYNKICESQICT